MLLCIACGPIDRAYRFKFYNNTTEDIYIILDENTKDEEITLGSDCWYAWASSWRYVDNKKRSWDTIIKDSIYIYVIDADMIKLPLGPLLQEDIDRITPEMVFSRITVYHHQTNGIGIFDVTYP